MTLTSVHRPTVCCSCTVFIHFYSNFNQVCAILVWKWNEEAKITLPQSLLFSSRSALFVVVRRLTGKTFSVILKNYLVGTCFPSMWTLLMPKLHVSFFLVKFFAWLTEKVERILWKFMINLGGVSFRMSGTRSILCQFLENRYEEIVYGEETKCMEFFKYFLSIRWIPGNVSSFGWISFVFFIFHKNH